MQVRPFAQPVEVQKVLQAGFANLSLRQPLFQVMKEVPDFQIAEEVRVSMLKWFVFFIRLLLLVDRTIARVLSFERRRDDQDVVQARLIVSRQNDARDARIDRQLRQLATELRQLVPFIHGTEFKQRLVTVANCGRLRRFEERKLFDRAEAQRLRLQNDRREVCSQNFRRRESLASRVILLAKKPNANTRPDASAASFALIG